MSRMSRAGPLLHKNYESRKCFGRGRHLALVFLYSSVIELKAYTLLIKFLIDGRRYTASSMPYNPYMGI